MSIKANIGGVYKEVKSGYCNINGVWRKIKSGHCNINGAWKQAHSTRVYLYKDGNKTVNWIPNYNIGTPPINWGMTGDTVLEWNSNYIYLGACGDTNSDTDKVRTISCPVNTEVALDVTNYKKFCVDCEVYVNDVNWAQLYLAAYAGGVQISVYESKGTPRQVLALDISSITGDIIFYITAVGKGDFHYCEAKVYNVWLE